jgi:two-component system, cell cycle sensor histidine kinase and response regulator CckA
MKASRTKQQEYMENFHASLYKNNHVVMLLIDPTDGSIVDANPAAESFYGWTREELKRKNIADINTLAPAQIREEMQAAHEARRNHFFFRHRRADGSIRDVEVYSGSIEIQDRKLLYSIPFDITERKRAEAQLYERTAYLENLLNYANTPIIAWDDEHRITKFNPAFEQLTGRTFEEVAGKKLDILFPEATKQQSLHYIDRTRKGERWETVEIEIVDVEGTIKTLLWNSASIYAPDGQHITATIAQGYDITERKRAEEELRLSEERFKTIFEGSRDAIFITDPDARFIQVNQAACELTGYSITELLSMRIADLHTAEDLEAFKTYFSKIMAGETIVNEAKLLRKDGVRVSTEFSNKRVSIGGLPCVHTVARDISERKQAEAEREKLQAQLAQSQKIESIGRLAGGVAHDSNNMLSVILGHVELIKDQLPSDSPLQADLNEVQNAAQRSADLTRQLLAFARKQTVAPKILDLNETIESMLKMLRRLIGEDIDLKWEPGRALEPVLIDPTQVDQLLANLCVNSRDAIGHRTGRVTIETARVAFDGEYCATNPGFVPGDYVMLAVSDDGCGMDPETLSNIFEPFYTTKGLGKGTGLGLATVYGIVKQNHGFINAYSEPGRGTTFKIYLPVHKIGAGRATQRSTTPAPARGNETILLVEDEPAILAVGTKILERQGYTVLAAASPDEAMRLAKEHAGDIHLLITDVVMPKMNGRDLARNLLARYPELKCLFMSGYTANVIARHGVLDAGVHFMQKPFSVRDLSAKVRTALEVSE